MNTLQERESKSSEQREKLLEDMRDHLHKSLHLFSQRNMLTFAITIGVLFTLIATLSKMRYSNCSFAEVHVGYHLGKNVLLLYLSFLFIFNIVQRPWSRSKRWLLGTLGLLAISVLFSFIGYWVQVWLFDSTFSPRQVSASTVSDIVFAIFVLLLTALLFSLSRRQALLFETQQLQEQNVRAKYDTLKYQVSPHYLFNSLNTLNGLIGEDDDKARRYVQQLASTYRYIMQSRSFALLREELGFVESYLYLMQVRYGDHLKVQYNIPESRLDDVVVPISLQLLVENAIKHNVVSAKHPLLITIEVTNHDTIRVSNAVCLKSELQEGEGLGLVNLVERYRCLTERPVTISDADDVFSVEIPLLSDFEGKETIVKKD